MKTMKNTVKCLIAVFTMAMAFVVTNTTAQAAEATERTFDNSVSGIELNATQKLNKLGEGTYTGGYVTDIRQTGATLTSATVTWNAVTGAAAYYVVEVDSYGYVTNIINTVQDTSITLTLPESTYGYGVGVIPIDASGNYSTSYGASISVYTKPKKVTGLKISGAFASNNKLNVKWNESICYGFEVVCYNKKGKVVQTVDETYYLGTEFSKTNTQNIYTVKIRPYVYVNQTEKLYGEFSKTLYAVPQPAITSTDNDVRLNSVNLKWKKVKGATKYDIYVSSSQSGGFKKVASVKASTKSYKITKFNGKTINTKSTKYIKIVTTAKFGKKVKKSQSNAQLSATTYYY